MKSFLLRSSARSEFVARELPDAVSRARRELGDEAQIRCWKVRRGGLWGFFAHEYYVAGLEAPSGAMRQSTLASSAEVVDDILLANYDAARDNDESVGHLAPSPVGLEDLIAATDDALVIGDEDATRRAFSEVLAQAEALLTSPPPVPAPELARVTYERPEVCTPTRVDVPALRSRLERLGVPAAYLPAQGAGLDALWASLSTLPIVDPVSTVRGQLIAVVGSRRDAAQTAASLVRQLGLASRDVCDEAPSPQLRRRLQRRRRSLCTSIVVVEAPVGAAREATREWLAQIGADRVIGALSAHAKRSDVERWLGELEVIDSLACWRLGRHASVADLMGVAPICLLEGTPATTWSWLVQLLGALGD